jgi:hypothetical protein
MFDLDPRDHDDVRDPRDRDERDRDDDDVTLGRGPDAPRVHDRHDERRDRDDDRRDTRDDDHRDRDDVRWADRDRDPRGRNIDPRDVFTRGSICRADATARSIVHFRDDDVAAPLKQDIGGGPSRSARPPSRVTCESPKTGPQAPPGASVGSTLSAPR